MTVLSCSRAYRTDVDDSSLASTDTNSEVDAGNTECSSLESESEGEESMVEHTDTKNFLIST